MARGLASSRAAVILVVVTGTVIPFPVAQSVVRPLIPALALVALDEGTLDNNSYEAVQLADWLIKTGEVDRLPGRVGRWCREMVLDGRLPWKVR